MTEGEGEGESEVGEVSIKEYALSIDPFPRTGNIYKQLAAERNRYGRTQLPVLILYHILVAAMLKQKFSGLIQKYTGDIRLMEMLWNEIEKNYSNKKRYYHTLTHLDNLLHQLTEAQDQINDWDTILFTLFYHDIIYNASGNDNEEKSAELAKERLQLISFPKDKISKCVSQILATRGHLNNSDNDTNLFTDADLSVLGQDQDSYAWYCKQIRKEYSIYPDFIYKPGRKKVLNHFLNMDRIYKTKFFFDKFEDAARQNLLRELEVI